MRSSGSQPRPERVRPRQGACAGLLPCRPAPPRPFQSPRFLRNQAARSRCGALDIGARESLVAFLTGGWWTLGPFWIYGLRCGAGRAMPVCQVRGSPRRRVRMEEGLAWPPAGVGGASSAARRPRSELGIRGVGAGGDRSNCQHPRGVRGSPRSSPSPPQK